MLYGEYKVHLKREKIILFPGSNLVGVAIICYVHYNGNENVNKIKDIFLQR